MSPHLALVVLLSWGVREGDLARDEVLLYAVLWLLLLALRLTGHIAGITFYGGAMVLVIALLFHMGLGGTRIGSSTH